MNPEAAAIAERLDQVRRRTLALIEPLAPAELERQADPIMSPPLWDLGHIAAYEELWLVVRLGLGESLHPDLQAVYDAFETPRARRAEVRLLDEAAARRYLEEVRARALEGLARADLSPGAGPLVADGFVYEMVAEHEAQHSETVLQALKLLPPGAYVPPRARPLPANGAGDGGRVELPGGEVEVGAGPAGFAYDCERPRHRLRLAPFALARDPVTNGEHVEFIRDGGYRRPELWTEAGWAWREREGVRAPLHWQRDGEGGWVIRSFDRIEPLDPEGILCHVSAHEADAHARWAGARLPTEAEWEAAARDHGPADEGANLDQLAFGPARRGSLPPGPSGLRHLLGDVWEWTATEFDAYPGFRAFPYREYAEPFFGRGYRVLRGGSWATQPVAVRPTFRNWDLPERRQIFAGLRLAWDLEAGGAP